MVQRGVSVELSREDARRLIEVLEACAAILTTVASDDRVIDVSRASLVGAAHDWASFLRSELVEPS